MLTARREVRMCEACASPQFYPVLRSPSFISFFIGCQVIRLIQMEFRRRGDGRICNASAQISQRSVGSSGTLTQLVRSGDANRQASEVRLPGRDQSSELSSLVFSSLDQGAFDLRGNSKHTRKADASDGLR